MIIHIVLFKTFFFLVALSLAKINIVWLKLVNGHKSCSGDNNI